MLPSWVTFHKYRLCKSYVTQLGLPFISTGFVDPILPSWVTFHTCRLCQSYCNPIWLNFINPGFVNHM